MLFSRERRDPDRARTPSMGPLVLWASVAVVAAVAGAVALYFILAWLVRVDPHPETATGEQQKLLADLVKITLGLAAALGAAVALIVGYRRARVDESASHRDDQRLAGERARMFSTRYQDAADLIGHDKAAVRLAGIYAMSRLADDWGEQRQQCIDVLCAYLRLPYEPEVSENRRPRARRLTDRRVASAPPEPSSGEREVRLTVIRLITAHLQLEAARPWHGHDLDFTGAVFDGGDFHGAVFSGGSVKFTSTKFAGTVDFRSAVFSGGHINFGSAVFSGGHVDFMSAVFSGGHVDFMSAVFSGSYVNFDHAVFSGGHVGFYDAVFSGGHVNFGSAVFSDSYVNFDHAVFSGGHVGFSSAVFSGGRVDFGPAMFSGGHVNFSSAVFSGGDVDLGDADFQAGCEPEGLPELPPPAGYTPPYWATHRSNGGPL